MVNSKKTCINKTHVLVVIINDIVTSAKGTTSLIIITSTQCGDESYFNFVWKHLNTSNKTKKKTFLFLNPVEILKDSQTAWNYFCRYTHGHDKPCQGFVFGCKQDVVSNDYILSLHYAWWQTNILTPFVLVSAKPFVCYWRIFHRLYSSMP